MILILEPIREKNRTYFLSRAVIELIILRLS
jgi:hypothetical protein